MKYKYKLYSRKSRQLRFLLKQLKRGEFSSPFEQQKVLRKIRNLYQQLRNAIGLANMRRRLSMASMAFLFSLPLNVEAQTFGPQEINPFGIDEHYSGPLQSAVDINGDGLTDLFGGGMLAYFGMFENQFQVWLNEGNIITPSFPSLGANPFGASILFEDMGGFQVVDWDDDGDFDIVYNAYYDPVEYFLENIGTAVSPAFAAPVVEPELTIIDDFFRLVDLDSDGDLDMITSGYYSIIRTYENIGTPSSANFVEGWDGINLFAGANDVIGSWGFRAFDFADLDCDGDLDMYITELDWGGSWIKNFLLHNTGTPENPEFGDPNLDATIPFENDVSLHGTPVFMDIGDDDDPDLFFGSVSTKVWYNQNTTEYPGGASWILPLIENEIYTFDWEDFILDPYFPEPFWSIRIMELPQNGQLQYYGQDISNFEVIQVDNFQWLTYQPASDESGQAYASIKYKIGVESGLFSQETYTMTIDVEQDVATSEINTLPNTSIQPNPAKEQVSVSASFEKTPEKLTIEVRSLDGKLIKTIQPEIHTFTTMDVSLNELPSGMYFIKVIADNQSAVHRFVKT